MCKQINQNITTFLYIIVMQRLDNVYNKHCVFVPLIAYRGQISITKTLFHFAIKLSSFIYANSQQMSCGTIFTFI